MLEHQATLDVLWDAIKDLDARPDHMTADELSRLLGEVHRAALELDAVVARLLADAVKEGDREDGRSAS